MTRFRMVAVAALLAIVGAPLAYAAGLWPSLPIYGSAAFCSGYSAYPTTATTPGTLATPNQCNNNIPAGPTTLTGSEIFPADTGIGGNVGGAQTAMVPAALVASGAYNYATNSPQSTTLTLAIPNNVNTELLNPTGTLTAITITLPSSPIDGQQVAIGSSQALTPTLVIVGSGSQSVVGAPTALAAAGAVGRFIYRAANATWYRD